ncbi:hypothetical protein [Nocardioides daphniae]|uniref:Uncharacterized protein n=1 Tax=Nocardioides daphniae TaxID=402297 RepID=A0A4P7UD09_9ACTN|nr:hypothetical protein [Nocardioides daphniae]QCC77188.1 hypothetical protein E2C04_08170 [Nocardioides daphniae]GGD26941.1 hypothetical protein GCM10007231_27970 [Nocardioides daphniae]
MVTMVFISSVALLVGIVGSIVIWRFDAQRAEEIAHTPAMPRAASLAAGTVPAQRALQEGVRTRE